MVKAFLLCKNGLRPPPFLGGAHKKSSKTFIKMQLHCIFRNKIISCVINIWLFQTLPNKFSLALLLAFHLLEGVNVPFRLNNRKSCIRCQKLCKACFRRHMECAVLKRFLKVQGTFSIKKFLQIQLYHLGKLNLIRFIKTLYKTKLPSSVTA